MDIAWQVEGALYKKGGMDLYGEAKYEFAAQIKMGVVSFVDSIDKTSVRADSSASRGKAEIALFDAVFIVPLSAPIAKEDVQKNASRKHPPAMGVARPSGAL